MRDVFSIAGNLISGTNPSYSAEDFLSVMPQFDGRVPDALLQTYINMADASVREARWHAWWKEGMRLFIAHFCALYVSGTTNGADADSITAVSASRGMVNSKSVGDVSVGYDLSTLTNDLSGWGAWKETVYGEQFATLARMLGKAGMYIR